MVNFQKEIGFSSKNMMVYFVIVVLGPKEKKLLLQMVLLFQPMLQSVKNSKNQPMMNYFSEIIRSF